MNFLAIALATLLAQDPAAEEAPAKPEAPPRPERAPKGEKPAAAPEAPKSEADRLKQIGQEARKRDYAGYSDRMKMGEVVSRWFEDLVQEQVDDITQLSSPRFNLDGKISSSSADLKSRWSEVFKKREGEKYTIYDIDLLPLADAIQKYGKPPRRIAASAVPGSYVAVGNLSGRATVVIFARGGPAGWQAVAFHD